MPPLDPKEALEYLGFNDIESLDDFKAKFHEKYVGDEKAASEKFVKPAIGKLMGKVKQNLLNKAREEGLEFTLSEFDDKDLEDVHSILAEKKAGKYKSELEELRKKAGQNGDDVVKEWQEKFEKATKRASEEENLRKQLSQEFEHFKGQAQQQVKSVKVNYFKTDLLGKIKFKPGLKDLEKEGFNAYLEKNYRFDYDDQENPIVTDAQGNRIRSEKKADEWKSPEEVVTEVAKKFEIFAENPQSGKPVNGMVQQQESPRIGLPQPTNNQKRKVNPMFDKYL